MISHLDYLMSLPQISREVYGYEEQSKPNEHCVWVNTGYTQIIMAWVEADAHFRSRLKEIKGLNNESY